MESGGGGWSFLQWQELGPRPGRQAQAQGAAVNSGGSEPPKRGGTPAPSPAQCKYVSPLCEARAPHPPILAVSNLPTILRVEGIFPILQLRARTQKSEATSQGHSQSQKPGLLIPRLAPSHLPPPSAQEAQRALSLPEALEEGDRAALSLAPWSEATGLARWALGLEKGEPSQRSSPALGLLVATAAPRNAPCPPLLRPSTGPPAPPPREPPQRGHLSLLEPHRVCRWTHVPRDPSCPGPGAPVT